MADATQVKENLCQIRDRVLRLALEFRLVVGRTRIKEMRTWCDGKNQLLQQQLAGMKNAASSAGYDLGKDLPHDREYADSYGSKIRPMSEVELTDEVLSYKTEVQEFLDKRSVKSMPETIQAHIDQIIETFAAPLPDSILNSARSSDAKRPPPVTAAVALGWIQSESKNIQYSTGRMQERWAKDFVAGNYGKRAMELAAERTEGKVSGYNNEGGASYTRIDQSMGHIRGNWERVGGLLPDTTNHLTDQSLYDAYDAALNDYWGFIGKIARGLRQNGVANVVGSLFQTHLNNHKGYTKTAGDKIIDATKSLDKEKVAKVAEWAAKTQSKLDDAIKAAKGQ